MKNNPEHLEPRRLFAAGDPDPAFGTAGRIVEPSALNPTIIDTLLQANDKLVIAGAQNSGSKRDYLLRRFNTDGSPDNSFGGDGTVTGRFDANQDAEFWKIAVTSDGKIVGLAVNRTDTSGAHNDFLARFNADGTLDTSFSSDGWLAHSSGSFDVAIAVQPDGSILLADGANVTRYTSTGALDSTFGTAGTLAQPLGASSAITTLEPQSSGAIFVGGAVGAIDADREFAIAKLNANGSPAAGFGTGGLVTDKVSSGDQNFGPAADVVRDLVVLADGSIIASGNSGVFLYAVKYDAAGTRDMTFGDTGRQRFRIDSAAGESFVDDDGRVYVSALDRVARLTANGQIDPGLGNVFGGGSAELFENYDGLAAGVTSTGRLLVAGIHRGGVFGSGRDLVIVQRLTEDDGNPSPITLAGGTVAIAGTSAADVIFAIDQGLRFEASLNGFGRQFDPDDVDRVTVAGGAGGDFIQMSLLLTPAHVLGGDGSDSIFGGSKNDTLQGNAQKDFIAGNNGADRITGNGGNDKLEGGLGHDRIYGGAGRDGIAASRGNDYIDGGLGPDIIIGGDGPDVAKADDDDELIEIETTV